jgi:D-3-phosphoglycerate dehydrogenase
LKTYANGIELRGKPWNSRYYRIGQATAKMALGLGMKVIAADSFIPQVDIKVTLTAIYYNNNRFSTTKLFI